MWILIKDHLGNKRHINVNFISDFYFNGSTTVIWLVNGAPLEIAEDKTKEIMEVIRMGTNAGIKQIGE